MPLFESGLVTSEGVVTVSTVLYNTRYFRRPKQLVLYVPLFESGLVSSKGVVTTTQGISREIISKFIRTLTVANDKNTLR